MFSIRVSRVYLVLDNHSGVAAETVKLYNSCLWNTKEGINLVWCFLRYLDARHCFPRSQIQPAPFCTPRMIEMKVYSYCSYVQLGADFLLYSYELVNRG